jgi:hypothetical protein
MKEYTDAKLISEDCMVKRNFTGLHGGGQWLQKHMSSIVIVHSEYGKIALNREEMVNLKLFLEKSLEEEF